MWTFDNDTKRMVFREVTYVPGFFKIVDEILVNAADRKVSRALLVLLRVLTLPRLSTPPWIP